MKCKPWSANQELYMNNIYKCIQTHTHISKSASATPLWRSLSLIHQTILTRFFFSKQRFLEYSIWCLKSNFLNLINSTSLFSFPFFGLPCYYCWNSSISDLLLHQLHLKCRQLSLSICFLCSAFAFLLFNSSILQIPLSLYSNSPLSTGPPGTHTSFVVCRTADIELDPGFVSCNLSPNCSCKWKAL